MHRGPVLGSKLLVAVISPTETLKRWYWLSCTRRGEIIRASLGIRLGARPRAFLVGCKWCGLTFVNRSRSYGISSTSWRLAVFFNRREIINSRLDLVQPYHHILYPWVPCSSGCIISYTCIGAYLLHSRSTDQESHWNLVRFSAETALSFSTTTFNSLRTALTLTWPFLKICSSHISV